MCVFSRREILVGMGAAGLSPLIVSMGCSSDALPELPVYEWNGSLGPENLFEHGVASGDPLPDGVIIWTRISSETAPAEPPESDDPLSVWWEVALDEAFERRVKQGTVRANPDSDFTVKVDVSELVWGRNYYYRFFAQGRQSPIGRTRLAPSGEEASQLRFGVCACSSYGSGWFHGYRHMAERADLDAVVHLGDYTYEYGNDDITDVDGNPVFIRQVEPPHETVTLEDYRIRLSQHRRDADLQECHRQHPFIVVWDDHETANDCWMGGASNHDPETEGPWEERLAAARQAFFEWIPLRERADQQIYRAFKYGNLADIVMLDTRIEGREEQYVVPTFSPNDPNLPENIISSSQETWLKDQLIGSTAKWKIIGSQVLMSLWQLGENNYFYWDQWHAYPKGRERVLSFIRDNDIANVVVVAGDVHSSWAMDVTMGDGSYNPDTQDGAVTVEFVAPGITAPNPFGTLTERVVSGSPHARYAELESKGYFVLDVQADKVQADWYLLDGVEQDQGNESLDASWAVLDGNKHVVEMSAPETPIEEPLPLAG
jgi:alkaline phosphatase D